MATTVGSRPKVPKRLQGIWRRERTNLGKRPVGARVEVTKFKPHPFGNLVESHYLDSGHTLEEAEETFLRDFRQVK